MLRSLTSLTLTLLLTSLAACGDGKDDTDDGSSSSASTSSASSSTESTAATEPTGGESTDTTASTDATAASEATGGPNPTDPSSSSSTSDTTTGNEADEYGFVCVTLKQAESEEGDPFAGTTMIRLTLDYEPCLLDFFTNTHPELAPGTDEGLAVLGQWQPRLCSEPVDAPLVACEIDQFEVDNLIPRLTVSFKALDPAQIDGHTLLWGPAPLASLAGCEPTVRLSATDSVVGFGEGPPLWQAQSWNDPVGLVKSEATGCIEVAVAKAP